MCDNPPLDQKYVDDIIDYALTCKNCRRDDRLRVQLQKLIDSPHDVAVMCKRYVQNPDDDGTDNSTPLSLVQAAMYGSDVWINFDPGLQAQYAGSTVSLDPAAVLLHELVHAAADMTGERLVDYGTDVEFHSGDTDPIYGAVTFENIYRGCRALPQRDTYNSVYLPLSNQGCPNYCCQCPYRGKWNPQVGECAPNYHGAGCWLGQASTSTADAQAACNLFCDDLIGSVIDHGSPEDVACWPSTVYQGVNQAGLPTWIAQTVAANKCDNMPQYSQFVFCP